MNTNLTAGAPIETRLGSRHLADELTTLISLAAAAIVAIDRSTVKRHFKSDLSPVTAADEAAHSMILDGLARLLPGLPVVSEETRGSHPQVTPDSTFLLVDPLDGTREYIAGRNEFTVNIALICQGTPAFGCIAAPMLGLIWRGAANSGAERLELAAGQDVKSCTRVTGIRSRRLRDQDRVVTVSRSHLDPQTERLLTHFPNATEIRCGSSLKFCRITEGGADFYPRLAPTHEWDIAAGHAILAAAGGTLVTPRGETLSYGHFDDHFIVNGFLAVGDRNAAQQIVSIAKICCEGGSS